MTEQSLTPPQKYVENTVKAYEPTDPYYEFIVDHKGRQKRVKVSTDEGRRMSGSVAMVASAERPHQHHIYTPTRADLTNT